MKQDGVAVCAYIGLGSNLNDPVAQLDQAVEALSRFPLSRLLGVSHYYQSTPLGPSDQPDFINAVASLETSLSPLQLLDALQQQEQTQGRVKKRHWGERTLDLDILLYDDLVLDTPRLTLPHRELMWREFVLVPLHELAPSLVLPDGRVLEGLVERIELRGLQRLARDVESR